MKASLAIIGGTGLSSLAGMRVTHRQMVSTPFGQPSGVLSFGVLAGHPVVFLPRHGPAHNIPPHKINYRANIWALQHVGVTHAVAVAAVGGISPGMEPGSLVIPDQIIDYTWSREHTFFESDLDRVVHVDFTEPYCPRLRQQLLAAARDADLPVQGRGTYGAAQGPRLETAAEVRRMQRDGCDVVGMTGMPEAALAKERELGYAHCAVVANWAAGRSPEPITLQLMEQNLKVGMSRARALLAELIQTQPPAA